VEDLDGQVVALLTQELFGLPALDYSGPVVGVDDVITGVEYALDGAELVTDLERFLRGYFRNERPPSW